MTTEPRSDLIAELTQLEADTKALGANVTSAKATAQQTLADASSRAELEAALAAAQAKVAEIDAQRDGWRAEAWAWRKLAGQKQTTTFLTPAEVATKKFSGSGSKPSAPDRGPLEAVPDLVTPSSLSGRGAGVMAWGESMRKQEFEALLAPDVGEPSQGRLFQHYIHHLFYNIHRLAHWQSVLDLADTWPRLIAKFPRLWLEYKQLEQSLVHDCITGSLYVLHVHADMDPRVKAAEKVLTEYFHLFEEDRLADAAKMRYLNPGPGVYGKPLWHSANADYDAFEFRYLLWGRPEDRAAADYLARVLREAIDFVTAPDGKKIAVPSHGVEGRYRDQSGDFPHDFAHWMVYTSESMSDMEISALMGFKLMTPEVVEAFSRTHYWTAPTQGGPASNVYAKDMGGGGLWEGAKAQRVVQFRDGSTVPARWKITSFGESQGVHSYQRGHTFALAYRATDLLPVWKPELEALDGRALLGRHATRQALLSIEMAGERL